MAFCGAACRLPQTAVCPAPREMMRKSFWGWFGVFKLKSLQHMGGLHQRMLSVAEYSSSVFWDKLPSHFSLDDCDWQSRVLLGFIYWLKQAGLFEFRNYPLVFLKERAEYYLIFLKETPGFASIRFLVSNCLCSTLKLKMYPEDENGETCSGGRHWVPQLNEQEKWTLPGVPFCSLTFSTFLLRGECFCSFGWVQSPRKKFQRTEMEHLIYHVVSLSTLLWGFAQCMDIAGRESALAGTGELHPCVSSCSTPKSAPGSRRYCSLVHDIFLGTVLRYHKNKGHQKIYFWFKEKEIYFFTAFLLYLQRGYC